MSGAKGMMVGSDLTREGENCHQAKIDDAHVCVNGSAATTQSRDRRVLSARARQVADDSLFGGIAPGVRPSARHR
jgi:hypothetical protein